MDRSIVEDEYGNKNSVRAVLVGDIKELNSLNQNIKTVEGKIQLHSHERVEVNKYVNDIIPPLILELRFFLDPIHWVFFEEISIDVLNKKHQRFESVLEVTKRKYPL